MIRQLLSRVRRKRRRRYLNELTRLSERLPGGYR